MPAPTDVAAASAQDELTRRMRACILRLLDERGSSGICPTEAAHTLASQFGVDWQHLMRPLRLVISGLADDGAVHVRQHDVAVDINDVRGPVRIFRRTLAESWASDPGA